MKFRYASGGILVAALLVLPSGAAARQGGQVDSLTTQQCAHERAAIGKKAFRKKYGAKRTMRACTRHTHSQVAAAARTAQQDCEDELAQIGPDDFIFEYGEDPTDSVDSVMQECVAEGVDQALNPDTGDDSLDDGTAA